MTTDRDVTDRTSPVCDRICVDLGDRGYEVVIRDGLLDHVGEFLAPFKLGPDTVIVTNPVVKRYYGTRVVRSLRAVGLKPIVLALPDGERTKSLRWVAKILNELLRRRYERKAWLVALGGGVIGDLTGFAASVYLRGIPFVQVPTTLVAQVDSSLGGKTGVNHRLGKNLIGTFHQPSLVLSDPLILLKLREREYASGLYEALKYGVIRDAALFEDFERNVPLFLKRDPEAVERLVARCAAIKAEVVMSDEKESDLRRILNFGHTIGHGLEAASRYQRLKHGEAVGYGMIAAARIGTALEKTPENDRHRIEGAIASLGRLPALDGVTSKNVLGALQHDKKIRDGVIHFVLARGVGRAEVTPNVPFEVVREVVKGILNDAKRLPGPG